MIARCLREDLPFGVVYHRGSELSDIGCSATVTQVVKRYDDGRMDIVAVGSERFAIDRIDDSGIYLQADVRFLDTAPEDGEHESLHEHAISELLKYGYFAEIELHRATLNELTTNQLSYLIAGVDLFGMDTKQELLEIEHAPTRLVRAVAALEGVNARLAATARIKRNLGADFDLESLWN